MKHFLGLTIALFLTATAVLAESERVITTNGHGVVDAVPDMASIDIGVTHQAKTAAEALRLTSDAVRSVLSRLQDRGIEARDMQTQGLSLQPVRNRRQNNNDAPPKIVGFSASNSLMVRVRDLETLGSILDAVVKDGANTFNGLRFSVQDPTPLVSEARAKAVENAMAKAAQLAMAAGVTLGPVQSITENGGTPRPVMMEMRSARASADVPIATGEVSLSTQVTMVFSILD